MKIIVGITGASGSIYARQLIEQLLKSSEVEEVAVVMSSNGQAVMQHEQQHITTTDPRLTLYDNSNMFAPIASGSANYDVMVIIPCSAGSVGRIANGVSDSLLTRSADVMLKERRKLIVVLRETPLNLIHLRNLTTITECGAIIVPASPSFYSHPATVEELCATVIERIISLIGIDLPHYQWRGE